MSKGWTRRIAVARDSDFEDQAACIFAASGTEERGRLPFWDDRIKRLPATCSEVEAQEAGQIQVSIGGRPSVVALRDSNALRTIFQGRDSGYLDISGLGHHVWAPLLREGLSCLTTLWVVYVEPERYRPHPSPTSGLMFDLSAEIGGVSPLPGYANLRGPRDEAESLFVPFLGFEGTRARQVAMSLDPVPRVIPFVGVPGFRAEYPFVAITCNQDFLDDHQAHADVRVARSNCPFEAYEALSELRKEYPRSYFYLAPIGTKPHALGAIWYAIDHPADTEIMYDHPVRKPQRTHGVGTVHVYCLKNG